MIVTKEKVNENRQLEFDYSKGIFMLAIFFIHAFQATLSDTGSPVYQIIYMISTTMAGAPLFIFVMGMGTVYSRRCSARTMLKDGGKLIGFQYLQNLSFILALSLPFGCYLLMNQADGMKSAFGALLFVYGQYINIFFLAGEIYLVLALLRAVRLPWFGYLILGLGLNFISPYLSGQANPTSVGSYLWSLAAGGPPYVSFTVTYYLAYALLGVAFGIGWKHVKDKKTAYKIIMAVAALIMAAWWIYVYLAGGRQLKTMFNLCQEGYIYPGGFRTVVGIAHIMFMTGLFFFWLDRKERTGFLSEQLLYYCRHISKYYAIHISFYLFAFSCHGFKGFSFAGCLILMVLDMAYTELLVRGWNHFHPGKKG